MGCRWWYHLIITNTQLDKCTAATAGAGHRCWLLVATRRDRSRGCWRWLGIVIFLWFLPIRTRSRIQTCLLRIIIIRVILLLILSLLLLLLMLFGTGSAIFLRLLLILTLLLLSLLIIRIGLLSLQVISRWWAAIHSSFFVNGLVPGFLSCSALMWIETVILESVRCMWC